MSQYTSYWLYQKYEKRGNQDFLPAYPNVFSIDGEGTMTPSMKKEYDEACGYTGGCDPSYDWWEIPITEDYECDECDLDIDFRWTDTSAFTYFGECKYKVQNQEYRVENGDWVATNQTKYSTEPVDCSNGKKMIVKTSDGFEFYSRCGTSDGQYYNAPSTNDEWFWHNGVTNDLFDKYNMCKEPMELFGISYDLRGGTATGYTGIDQSNDKVLRPTELGETITSVTFGDCVTEIGNNDYCTENGNIGFNLYPNLRSITLSNNIEKIGRGAFIGNGGLTGITFPDSVKVLGQSYPGEFTCDNAFTTIPFGTFQGCGLVNVNTNKIEHIGAWTFAGNRDLEKITIGSACTRIDYAVFNNCPKLQQIVFEGTTVPECYSTCSMQPSGLCESHEWIFTDERDYADHRPEYLPSGCTIYVPCDALDTFKNSPLTSGYTDIISGYGGTCGDLPYITEYRTVSGTPYCDGSDLYQDVYSQVSTDGGTTWETTATTTTLIEAGSAQCNYNPENEYLTFVMLSNSGSIGFSGASTAKTVEYSVDSGATWIALPASRYTKYTEDVNEGDEIMFRGNLASKSGIIGKFVTSSNIALKGNIMSLLYSDNFSGQTSLSSCTFLYMFSDCSNLTNAENLVLPATVLTENCYEYMFYGCGNLIKAPSVLPATTLANGCYGQMFDSCTSLTTAPELPATTLARGCYYGMFAGCTNLNYIKCLATDISAVSCTNNWVNNVSANGTFVKASSMTSWTTGGNGIPSGWTVEDAT